VKPYSPNRFKLTCIGLLAGLVLGGASVVCAEFTDDRIYSEKELKKLVSVDILTQIPPISTPEEVNGRRRTVLRELAIVSFLMTFITAGVAISYLFG
jgi:hypothetical protein